MKLSIEFAHPQLPRCSTHLAASSLSDIQGISACSVIWGLIYSERLFGLTDVHSALSFPSREHDRKTTRAQAFSWPELRWRPYSIQGSLLDFFIRIYQRFTLCTCISRNIALSKAGPNIVVSEELGCGMLINMLTEAPP